MTDAEIIAFFQAIGERALANTRRKGFMENREALQALAEANGLGAYARGLIESQMIALQHSELSEGLEGIRKDLMDDHLPEFRMIECEMADTIIRIMQHAAAYRYRLGEALAAKLAFNESRPRLHGGKAF